MKGEIQPNVITVNRYKMTILGIIDLTPVTISGIDDELETVKLPDRTVASNGQRKASSFKMGIPAHHELEQLAMEAWFIEGQDPISPTYKKTCTLEMTAISGNGSRSFTLMGVFPTKRAIPALALTDEGTMATMEWDMSIDNILPI
jgi:hypothetical protein